MKRWMVMVCVFCFLLFCCACNVQGTDETKENEQEEETEIIQPERSVNFSFWDWQVGTAGDAESLAETIKELGFTGVDFTFRWTSLEYTKGTYSFRYIDTILDKFAEQDLFVSTSLMFWSIGLPWWEDLEWQQMPDGTIYEFSGRGASPSFEDEETVKKMEDAYRAFTSHIYERYGERLIRMHARTSQYGELEYFCSAGEMLDYGEPAVEAFRTFLKEKYKTPEGLIKASGNALRFTSLDELDGMSGKNLSDAFYYDWQVYRQQACLELTSSFRDIQHETAPGVPFALQVGSIWDAAATNLRGVFDPWLASKSCDILHTDDGPGYPHDFSIDYTDVNPDVELASEIDGRWHPTIEALVQKGDKSLSPYITQATRMGKKGIKYLNTANWNSGDIDEFADALSQYPEVFLNAELREAADPEIAILINTADVVYKMKAADQLYGAPFTRLSSNGDKQVRFVTDTQLLEHPELLDEIKVLYLGNAYGGYYMTEALGKLLKSSDVMLYTEEDPSTLTLRNEYRQDMPAESTPEFTLKV